MSEHPPGVPLVGNMSKTAEETTFLSANHRKYTYGNRVYDWHLRAFLDQLSSLLNKSGARTVLDAGCGEGFVLSYLYDKDPSLRLTGVDISESAIMYATNQFGEKARFRTGSIYKLPFSDRSFDTVLCSEVLEHLDDPARAVNELKRVARNYVLITVPLEPYFQWLNNIGQWLGVSVDPEHVNFWNKKAFRSFLQEHFEQPDASVKHIYQLALAQV